MTTKATKPETEIDILDPNGDRLHLDGAGIDVIVERLRTRQIFKLIKILTVGAGPALAELTIDERTDPEELTKDLITVLLLSVGDAEDETIDFLKSMVKPVGLIEPERSKIDREANTEAYLSLYRMLDNPDAGDTLDLLLWIIKTETPNLKALGKQIAALLPSAAKRKTSSKQPSKASTPVES